MEGSYIDPPITFRYFSLSATVSLKSKDWQLVLGADALNAQGTLSSQEKMVWLLNPRPGYGISLIYILLISNGSSILNE